MIKTVVSVGLPVGETLQVKKQRLMPQVPLTGREKRICIVTGTHGDELEGQFVCYEVQQRIKQAPHLLAGIVDIYPALNPLGIDSLTRGIPGFDLDMNRIFPGGYDGSMAEYTAARLVDDLTGASLCVDIHASNIFIREIPQIRMSEQTSESLLPYALEMNTDFIWIHSASTVLEATLAHSVNQAGTPTLVVEMGVGMRMTREYCLQLTEGLFAVMKKMGIWQGAVIQPKKPLVSTDGQVGFINASVSGIFIPTVAHWRNVKKGEPVGQIIDPLAGVCLEEVVAPNSGIIFTLREYPVVDEGSLIARILEIPA